MKIYKLINTKTKEEHLCNKITIDGFDYYVSDTRITELSANDRYYTIVENPRRIVRYSKHIQSKDAVIIATNNPNIDVPKVVDEVDQYTMAKEYAIKTKSPNRESHRQGFVKGYNKSQETHPFSEEDMIDFYEWCDTSEEAVIFWRKNRVDPDMSGNHWKKIRENRKKLLQLWKEQRTKIIYYE